MPPRLTRFRVVGVGLAALLLVSSTLTIHRLALDPLAQDAFLAPPRLLIATIEAEIALGLWFLSGHALRANRVSALVFFGNLAGVSLPLAPDGQRRCGAFGRAAPGAWRPARTANGPPTSRLQRMVKALAWPRGEAVAVESVLRVCRRGSGRGGPGVPGPIQVPCTSGSAS